MRVPYYLLASALCCAIAIGACSDGPTDVADEAALSSEAATSDVAVDKGQPEGKGKKDKVDICHYDASLNEGAGTWVHLNVNGNSWDGEGDGCGGKENKHSKQTGHNGHEMDTNWNEDTTFVATECEMFCYEDRDGDGLTDDVDPCIFDPDNDSDGDGVCLSDGDTCYADPGDSDGGTDTDGDGWCDDNDNCVDDPNDQTNSDLDSFGDACDNCPGTDNEDQVDTDADGAGDACDSCELDDGSTDGTDGDDDGYCDGFGDCDDSDPAVNPDATEVCNGVDDDCDAATDEDDVCSSACNDPQTCGSYAFGCGDGKACAAIDVTTCWTDADDSSGFCAADFSCGDDEAIDCDEDSDCASGRCAISTCCGTSLTGTCVPTGHECDAPAAPGADLVPRLFKGQAQTATGR